MYDSLITLIQMLDNSEKYTSYYRDETEQLIIEINIESYIFPYTQEGLSEAIEELENLL